MRDILHEGHMMNNTNLNVKIDQHGSLAGHVVPGSMFIIWATWWLLAHTYRVVKGSKNP